MAIINTGTTPKLITKPTPAITVSNSGLITAQTSQAESGYVEAGTAKATKQLSAQAGKTVNPGTGTITAVSSGKYTTGNVYVAGDVNLSPENIKKGVSIFGVSGELGKSGKNLTWSESIGNTDEISLTRTSGGFAIKIKGEFDYISIYAAYYVTSTSAAGRIYGYGITDSWGYLTASGLEGQEVSLTVVSTNGYTYASSPASMPYVLNYNFVYVLAI